jgi:hypothetical protein
LRPPHANILYTTLSKRSSGLRALRGLANQASPRRGDFLIGRMTSREANALVVLRHKAHKHAVSLFFGVLSVHEGADMNVLCHIARVPVRATCS